MLSRRLLDRRFHGLGICNARPREHVGHNVAVIGGGRPGRERASLIGQCDALGRQGTGNGHGNLLVDEAVRSVGDFLRSRPAEIKMIGV